MLVPKYWPVKETDGFLEADEILYFFNFKVKWEYKVAKHHEYCKIVKSTLSDLKEKLLNDLSRLPQTLKITVAKWMGSPLTI